MFSRSNKALFRIVNRYKNVSLVGTSYQKQNWYTSQHTAVSWKSTIWSSLFFLGLIFLGEENSSVTVNSLKADYKKYKHGISSIKRTHMCNCHESYLSTELKLIAIIKSGPDKFGNTLLFWRALQSRWKNFNLHCCKFAWANIKSGQRRP